MNWEKTERHTHGAYEIIVWGDRYLATRHELKNQITQLGVFDTLEGAKQACEDHWKTLVR